jgi:hypothetical protein
MLKREQRVTVLIYGIFLLIGAVLPKMVSAQDYEDSPFGFIQGEVVQGYRPSAEYLNDLGVYWDKIAPGGTPIFIETNDPDNINFQTDVNFSGMDDYLQTLVVDNGIIVPLILLVFVQVNGEITQLDFDDYEEFGTVMIERYDGDGVDDALGSPLIRYWFLGGSEMNNGVAQGAPVEERPWPLTEAQTAEYVKIGYDLIAELHPEFRAILGGSNAVGTWQQGGNDDYYYNLISELTGNNECSDLIFDYHKGSNPYMFKSQIDCMNIVDETLNEFGYNGNEIWTTDCGGSWEEWQGFTEAEQAGDVIRRYAYTIANGQKKMYWTRVEEYNWPGVSMFDYMGLVHNPINDPAGEEKDWKKLSYYTYKLMVEKLEGSDWDNTQTIQESDNVYIYKFMKNGEPVWTAWWGYFDDPGYVPGDLIEFELYVGDIDSVLITQAVPDAENGNYLDPDDYPYFFLTETKPVIDGIVTVVLGENPVFIEELSITSIEEETIEPAGIRLYQNFPNPFQSETTICYALHCSGSVSVTIFDTAGHRVCTPVDATQPAGNHSVVWDGRDNRGHSVSSGIYYCRLDTGEVSLTNAMLLL